MKIIKSKEFKKGSLWVFYWPKSLTEFEVGCDIKGVEGKIYPVNGIATITLFDDDFNDICIDKSLDVQFKNVTPEMCLDLLQKLLNNEKGVN